MRSDRRHFGGSDPFQLNVKRNYTFFQKIMKPVTLRRKIKIKVEKLSDSSTVVKLKAIENDADSRGYMQYSR
jgi:hypothetical protein